jgi:signal transduction histidine kinase/ActR/RegA family two-component response regulator
MPIITIVEFIKAHREDIIAEWMSVANALTDRDLSPDDLRDAVHEILDSIVNAMESAESAPPENVLTGKPVATRELAKVAETHASHRFTQRFALKQMAAEYRALRANVTRRWLGRRKGKPKSANALARELALFNAAVDWSLTSAVAWYDERLRRQQEQLKIADQNKNEFLAVLGHELRNPLAPLRTGLELLGRARTKPELLETLQPMMDRQFSHLARLVDDLLDFARISRGDIQLQIGPIDLNLVVTTAVEQVTASMREKRNELVMQLSPTHLPALGDFDRLTQVVANLLSNSNKYSDPASRITVTTREEHETAVISVADTGFGIPPQEVEKIFELFTQIPEHRKRTGGGGLGIGLALSRRLVEMHRGSIKATSNGLGQGTEVIVTLPSARNSAEQHAAHASVGDRLTPSRRILVVDDNKDAADSFAALLREMGHDTRTAYEAQSAVAQVDDFKPDVAFLDLGLPHADGIELGRMIRQKAGGANVALIALTGWSQDQDRRRTADAHFDAHLVKPVTVEQIREVLARRKPASAPGDGA